MYEGAPFRLQQYMSRTRFEAILSAIKYTKEHPPAFVDRFWEVRELIDAWNSMSKTFSPSWINTIDESISKWINEFTCPGFMYVPRKPWPFGNKYHDAGCADSDIIWQVDLREAKDRPVQLGGGGKSMMTRVRQQGLCCDSQNLFMEQEKCLFLTVAFVFCRRLWN